MGSIRLLEEKSLATKFQIMIEIAARQPDISRKTLAGKLGITSQAISFYVKQMEDDGWIRTNNRLGIKVTREGVDWLKKALREMDRYLDRVEKVTRNISISAAVADHDLFTGQCVGLMMRDGLLSACNANTCEAKGVVIAYAEKGQDVGIANIEGLVELDIEKVTILAIPGIQKGGSRRVDLNLCRKMITDDKMLVCAIGIEAVTTLRLLGINSGHCYGIRSVVVDAVKHGVRVLVACVSNEIPVLIKTLEDQSLDYQVLDTEISD